MVTTTSAPFAASAAETAGSTPSAAAAASASGTTSYPTTVCPFFSRFAAIGRPIVPVPMNPILIASLLAARRSPGPWRWPGGPPPRAGRAPRGGGGPGPGPLGEPHEAVDVLRHERDREARVERAGQDVARELQLAGVRAAARGGKDVGGARRGDALAHRDRQRPP